MRAPSRSRGGPARGAELRALPLPSSTRPRPFQRLLGSPAVPRNPLAQGLVSGGGCEHVTGPAFRGFGMVGKVRRPRARLHAAAVKAARLAPRAKEAEAAVASTATTSSRPAEVTAWSGVGGQDWGLVTSDIFAGTTIDPKALVQKLDSDTRSVISASAGAEAKPVLSKKEKMKLRRARWLQKIDAIKAAEETRKAEARRKATAVVGDLHPLMEALPELSELVTASRPRKKLKSAPRQKTEPTDFSRMTQAQKRKLLDDEMVRFQEVVTSPSYQADPLRAIGEHLSKRLRQEEEGARL